MFKQILTLMRGRSFDAAEAYTDRHAVALLRQQIRDCAQAVQAARRAVAVAVAQNQQEIDQHARITGQFADLEARTLSALEQGRDDLAREGAEAIAHLEAEKETSEKAQATFRTSIERLKKVVREAETRLRELQRGQRLVTATDTTQRLRETAPESGLATLREAEETLARLQMRQQQIDAAALAMDELETTGDAASVAERMAAAGCGAPIGPNADTVIERLRHKLSSSQN